MDLEPSVPVVFFLCALISSTLSLTTADDNSTSASEEPFSPLLLDFPERIISEEKPLESDESTEHLSTPSDSEMVQKGTHLDDASLSKSGQPGKFVKNVAPEIFREAAFLPEDGFSSEDNETSVSSKDKSEYTVGEPEQSLFTSPGTPTVSESETENPSDNDLTVPSSVPENASTGTSTPQTATASAKPSANTVGMIDEEPATDKYDAVMHKDSEEESGESTAVTPVLTDERPHVDDKFSFLFRNKSDMGSSESSPSTPVILEELTVVDDENSVILPDKSESEEAKSVENTPLLVDETPTTEDDVSLMLRNASENSSTISPILVDERPHTDEISEFELSISTRESSVTPYPDDETKANTPRFIEQVPASVDDDAAFVGDNHPGTVAHADDNSRQSTAATTLVTGSTAESTSPLPESTTRASRTRFTIFSAMSSFFTLPDDNFESSSIHTTTTSDVTRVSSSVASPQTSLATESTSVEAFSEFPFVPTEDREYASLEVANTTERTTSSTASPHPDSTGASTVTVSNTEGEKTTLEQISQHFSSTVSVESTAMTSAEPKQEDTTLSSGTTVETKSVAHDSETSHNEDDNTNKDKKECSQEMHTFDKVPKSTRNETVELGNTSNFTYVFVKAKDVRTNSKCGLVTAIFSTSYQELTKKSEENLFMLFHMWLVQTVMEGVGNHATNWSLLASIGSNDGRLSANRVLIPRVIFVRPQKYFKQQELSYTFYVKYGNGTICSDLLLPLLMSKADKLLLIMNVTGCHFVHGMGTVFWRDIKRSGYDVLSRYGVVIIAISMLLLMVLISACVYFIYHRRKSRVSVNLSDRTYLQDDMHMAIEIGDLTPAHVILAGEEDKKPITNGNKVQSLEDRCWMYIDDTSTEGENAVEAERYDTRL